MHTLTFSRRDFLNRSLTCATGAALAAVVPAGVITQACAAEKRSAEIYNNPFISIIIDDVGYNRSRVMPFLDLNAPITFSILPHLPYSLRLAEQIHTEGHEVMLHQPMEPYDRSIDPGPGALYLQQSRSEHYRIIDKNLGSIPFVVGVNNHMGSRYTESQENIYDALSIIKERKLFFIDSFTSSNSIAFDIARQLEMRAAFRNIFIDNVWDKDYVCNQLAKLKRHARRFGHAVGIGHPRRETIEALRDFFDEVENEGFIFTYASRIVYT